jgi:hypothetical protein
MLDENENKNENENAVIYFIYYYCYLDHVMGTGPGILLHRHHRGEEGLGRWVCDYFPYRVCG